MNIAHDNERRRITPFPGGRGFCRLCEADLIAKCGEIKVWHWSHVADRNCDPWKEHETPWHRNWKGRFNTDWHEIIIDNEGERHIADICTPNGLVLEFQHSSISRATIAEREEFYDNMIWVIDGEAFKSNIKFYSVVKDKLRQIDMKLREGRPDIDNEYETKIDEAKNKIRINDYDIRQRITKEEWLRKHFEEYQSYIQDIDGLVVKTIALWAGERHSMDNGRGYDLADSLAKIFRNAVDENTEHISRLERRLQTVNAYLEQLDSLPTFQLRGQAYKVVPLSSVRKENYTRFLLVSIESSRSLFPKTRKIKDELDLERIRYLQSANYMVLTDVSSDTDQYNRELASISGQLSELKQYVSSLVPAMRETVRSEIISKCEQLNKDIESCDNETKVLIDDNSKLELLVAKLTSQKSEAKNRAEIELSKQVKEERIEVMQDYKGEYRYSWKQRRPSWDNATAPMFVDRGDGFVYRLDPHGYSLRYSYQEFVDYCCKR